MKSTCIFITFFFLLASSVSSQSTKELNLTQLQDKVEIITDKWGVPHIYANNEHDLFFAQGYYAAKDRLFQFEI